MTKVKRIFGKKKKYPYDFTKEEIAIWEKVRPFTAVSRERAIALLRSVKHIVDRGIPGDIVECGVWKGGSMMAAAMALLQENDLLRQIYLYDTFEGMSPATEKDVLHSGELASDLVEEHSWLACSVESVKENFALTGYPQEKSHFIKGKVEDTLPAHAPEKIAILRLDTDWYESTKHELIHLYPRLVSGGILIIDDYGCWKGAKLAVDEYFKEEMPFLHRIDPTARLIIKK